METADRDKYGLCFACGQQNPIGLKLNFRFEGGKAKAEFTPAPTTRAGTGSFMGDSWRFAWMRPSGTSSTSRGSKG